MKVTLSSHRHSIYRVLRRQKAGYLRDVGGYTPEIIDSLAEDYDVPGIKLDLLV